VLIPAGARSQLASAAFSTASPCTPPQQPIMRVSASRHQREFKRFTRPVFPSPVTPGWNGSAWAFPRASHPADQQPNDRRRGGDRPPSTDLEQHSRHIRRTSNPVFTRIVRPRVAPRVAGRVGITPDMPVAKSEQVPRPIRSQVREQRSALADHASSGHGGAAHRFVCRKGSPIETAPWATTSSMSRRSCEGSVPVLHREVAAEAVRLGLAGPRWVTVAPNMGSSSDAPARACS
jgi:hypothetical protein